jgi:uncharacterized protein
MSRSSQGTRRRFVVRRSSIHGRGTYARVHIPKGSRLIEYTGERISHEMADERYGEEQENSPHTMLFTVDDETVIDATQWGSSARWFNHSCAPNCEATEENGRIFIDTIRAVRPGEELTYDYNLTLDEPHTPAVKRAHACLCGARSCRGTILGKKR